MPVRASRACATAARAGTRVSRARTRSSPAPPFTCSPPMATRSKSPRPVPHNAPAVPAAASHVRGESTMFWKLAAAVAAAIVATQIPQLAPYWFWILLLGVIVAFVIEGVRIVPQQSAWVVERLGKYHGTLEPGLNLIIPFLDRVAYVHSLKEVPLDVPEQVCITKDNTQLGVDGILYYQIG